MYPARGPWGGSSAFVKQMGRWLERHGYAVQYSVENADVVIVIDPREDLQNKAFGMDQIDSYRRSNPAVKVVHRVNECDQRKGTDWMDALLSEANKSADHTVFISQWLRDYHIERWFPRERPHTVVYNGADAGVFHPVGGARFHNTGGPFRIVTHHWSDNPLKGFDVYAEIDQKIAAGDLAATEFWVIGRWPQDIVWRAARTFAPTHGHDLASLLRACHAYVTASRWEPCGMHQVEGLQCGLPLLYHEDGGGIVEAGQRYGIGFRDDFSAAIQSMRDEYHRYRAAVLQDIPSGDRMCLAYMNIIQSLLCAGD